MELTGKAKEQFEKWYNIEYNKEQYNGVEFPHLDDFNDSPLIMKWGVYVDFFDSVGINVDVEYLGDDSFGFSFTTTSHRLPCGGVSGFDSRPEARTEAIKKACEVLESRK
jgi:hypothetical protein